MTSIFTLNGESDEGFGESVFVSSTGVNHVERGLSSLPSQFYDSTKLKEVLKILLEEYQEIENTIQHMFSVLNVDSANGVSLDEIGDKVGYHRPYNMSDDNYRKRIKIKILVNKSKGTYSDIYNILKLVLGTDNITIVPEYPVGFNFKADTPLQDLEMLNLVATATAITVKMSTSLKYSTGHSFCFNGGTGMGLGSNGHTGIGGEIRGRKEFS